MPIYGMFTYILRRWVHTRISNDRMGNFCKTAVQKMEPTKAPTKGMELQSTREFLINNIDALKRQLRALQNEGRKEFNRREIESAKRKFLEITSVQDNIDKQNRLLDIVTAHLFMEDQKRNMEFANNIERSIHRTIKFDGNAMEKQFDDLIDQEDERKDREEDIKALLDKLRDLKEQLNSEEHNTLFSSVNDEQMRRMFFPEGTETESLLHPSQSSSDMEQESILPNIYSPKDLVKAAQIEEEVESREREKQPRRQMMVLN